MTQYIETLKKVESIHADAIADYKRLIAEGESVHPGCILIFKEKLLYHETQLAALTAAIADMERLDIIRNTQTITTVQQSNSALCFSGAEANAVLDMLRAEANAAMEGGE